MIAVGAGLTTTFGPNTTTAQWVGYQLIQGIGRGAAMTMVSRLLSITPSYYAHKPKPANTSASHVDSP
jgi:hypothetical protein